jgi:hypothetical protein
MMEIYLAHVLLCFGGHYKLYVAQWIADEESDYEGVHLFFQECEEPAMKSEVIVADEGLSLPAILLENAVEISV